MFPWQRTTRINRYPTAPLRGCLLATLAAILVLAEAAAAAQPGTPARAGRIYKWVDEHGVTHYGQSIPPEYRDQGAAEMNKRGLTVNRIDPAATPEQRRAVEERAMREREEQKRQAEQRRRDTALMNTYTSPREIDEARERSLALPMQAIRTLEPRQKKGQERLDALTRQSADLHKAGKPVPEYLKEEIAEQKAELDTMRLERERHEAQIAAIRARYDADKQRYMELTAVAPR
jgi:hypothetical protein